LSWNVSAGLDKNQLDGLVVRVHRILMTDPAPAASPARMWPPGLNRSVVLVPFLLRHNPVQEAAAELSGVSQATVSRRWTGLLPVEKALAGAEDHDRAFARPVPPGDHTALTFYKKGW
jgi:hypothetical protein